MYLYELARDLGAEPRELINQAALDGLGHLVPNSTLTAEQVTTLRESYIRSSTQSRGSLFGAGATPPPLGAPPPPAPPAPSHPPDPPAEAFDPGAPLDGPLSGAGLGQPLGFTPPPGGAAAPPPPPSAPPPSAPPPAEPRWDDPAPWDPSGGGISFGGAPPPKPSYDPIDDRPPLSERDYVPEYRPDDRPLPKPPTSTTSRTVVIGVVGIIVIVLATMYIGRRMNIIGPGAERNCVITETPVVDGEGVIEEIVCIDGYGNEVRREVFEPDPDIRAIAFGTTVDGTTARVVDVDEFCRGASDFQDFRLGLIEQIGEAESMAPVGSWYEANDGFGDGGVGRMIDSFGNSGPDVRVVELRDYLRAVREAARSTSVPPAQMLLAAAEEAHGANAVAVRNFANSNC